MIPIFDDTAHKQQRRGCRVPQDISRRIGLLVARIHRALGSAGGAGRLDLLRKRRAVKRDAVIHRADLNAQPGKLLLTAGQAEQLLVRLHRAALSKIGQVGICIIHRHIGAEQHERCLGIERLRVRVGVGLIRCKKEALSQHGGGHILLAQSLHPEVHLALGGHGVILHIIV